ncbi:MAG: HAD-IA family hydrolase [Limibacillus sp.]
MKNDTAVSPPKAAAITAVLFDKDGTLIDFNATWRTAYEAVVLEVTGGDQDLAQRLLEAGGWDAAGQRFLAGSLCAAASTHEIAEAWATLLPGAQDASALAAHMDKRFTRAGALKVQAVTPLPDLFSMLKARGLLLGGYDSGNGRKPGPGMVLAFCRALGLEPASVAVVGDNGHDMEMGRRAGAGLLVGVLSGTSLAYDLEPAADYLLPDISHLPDLLNRLG